MGQVSFDSFLAPFVQKNEGTLCVDPLSQSEMVYKNTAVKVP